MDTPGERELWLTMQGGVGTIHLAESALFLSGHARYLRFVRIERGQRLFGRAFTGNLMEMSCQVANLRNRQMPLQIAPRPIPSAKSSHNSA